MADTQPQARIAFGYVTTLFFIWGAVTSVNDVLLPAVRSIFRLSTTEAFLTQFAFFLAYGIVSLPAAAIVARRGAASSIVVALGVMVAGCLLMPLATVFRAYAIVLVALFVIAAGITLLQVAANPLSAVLGRPDRSHFRLVLSQAFNSAGTVIAPLLAAETLLKGGLFDGGAPTEAKIAASLGRIDIAYAFIAAVTFALAVFIWRIRGTITAAAPATPRSTASIASVTIASTAEALRARWAVFGAAAIFLYVGAEVAIGSSIVGFLGEPGVMALAPAQAGRLVSVYWLGALAGRFLGSAILTRFAAARVLAGVAAIAALLCLVVAVAGGPVAGVTMLSIGLFNAVMFPVIFTLTIERSSASAAATSGLLCFAIVGGAFVPWGFARIVDASGGYAAAFLLPLACYLLIAAFALAAGRARVARDAVAPRAAH